MRLRLGFAPLTDAAPLLAADALGFFADEGLQVELVREVSWATVRDKVTLGALEGAHMLAPMPVAAALGVGSPPAEIVAPLVLARGGAAVTLSTRITEAVGTNSADLARLLRRRRDEGASPLTLAVVYPHALHNYLLRTWLTDAGVELDADVRLTVAAPSRMAGLLADGVIEGFCAGDPWGSAAEAAGAGRIVRRAGDVWPAAPDKVLGVGRAWAEADPPRLAGLIRAVGRGATWCETQTNRAALADLMARSLGVPAEIIDRGLPHLIFSGTAPQPKDASWVVEQMRRWGPGSGNADLDEIAARVFLRLN